MPEQYAISEARAAFAHALGRGDPQAAASLYTDDARLLPPSSGVLTGPAEIEAFWRAGIEVGITSAAFELSELHQRNGIAYEIGRYAIRLGTDGDAVVDRGNYVLVHVRQGDGAWRRAVEMFNPDEPITREEER